jgi:hypothetical protein
MIIVLCFQNAKHSNYSLLREYVETVYDCKWENNVNSTSCASLGINQLGNKLQIDPEVTIILYYILLDICKLFLFFIFCYWFCTSSMSKMFVYICLFFAIYAHMYLLLY